MGLSTETVKGTVLPFSAISGRSMSTLPSIGLASPSNFFTVCSQPSLASCARSAGARPTMATLAVAPRANLRRSGSLDGTVDLALSPTSQARLGEIPQTPLRLLGPLFKEPGRQASRCQQALTS